MTGRFILILLVMMMCVWAAMTSAAVDYFSSKRVPYVCYLTCGSKMTIKNEVYNLIRNGIRVSMQIIDRNDADIKKNLLQWLVPVGVLLEWGCDGSQIVLETASRATLFDSAHMWLILENEILSEESVSSSLDVLRRMNLSVDADVVVAINKGVQYDLIDVFNFGKIQGNDLEKKHIGTWRPGKGLNVSLSGFKYYDRWDFHNLTLRAISVILDRPKVFKPEMLSDLGYTVGVSVMTKIVTQQLWVLKEMHNFRSVNKHSAGHLTHHRNTTLLDRNILFNYTIAGRWIGSPARNSTLAVTNSLYWGEQDISCTCARIFTQWLDWVDVFFPPATTLE